jgi:hypothetical protein
MGSPLRGTTQIASTPLLIADCGLMILDYQSAIRVLLKLLGKVWVYTTVIPGSLLCGTTQIPLKVLRTYPEIQEEFAF